MSQARGCPQLERPEVAKNPQRGKGQETPKPIASSSTNHTKIVSIVKPTSREKSGSSQSPRRQSPRRQSDSPQTSVANRPAPQSPLTSNPPTVAGLAEADAPRAVRFDQDKQPLNFPSVLTGSKPTSPVVPASAAKYPLDASVTTRTRSPTAQTRRSLSTAAPTGQSTSRSGSAAAPRLVAPVRERRSLIVADTCGLLRMDKKQLQSFANYLARTGETIALPFVVLSELDHIQKDFSNPELQYRARQVRDWVRTLQEANYIRVQNGGESDNSIRSLG